MLTKRKLSALSIRSASQFVERVLYKKSTILPVAKQLPILLVLLLAVALFSFRLGSEGLWLDELNSLRDITERSPRDIVASPVRPLYYLLMMLWIRTGSSDVWLRLPSVFFAVISVYLLYQVGIYLLGKREGIIAALLLAISPAVVNHAQEIRMYTLSLCLTLAGTLFLVQALTAGRQKIPFEKASAQAAKAPKATTLAGWVVFRLLAMYTVPLNVLLLIPDLLVIFARFRTQKAVLKSFAKWLVVIGVLWLPAVIALLSAASPSSGYAQDHSGALPPGIAEIMRQLKFFTVWPFRVQENAIAALFYKIFTLLVMGLAGAGLIRKHKSPHLLWICAWCILPIVPIVAFSHIVMPVWRTRYMLFVSPYLFLLLAAGLVRLWKSWRVSAIVIGAIYLFAAGGGLFHHYTVQERSDYKFNVATIEQYEQPGDGLVWSYECCKRGLYRYYEGAMKPHFNSVAAIQTPDDVSRWAEQLPTDYSRLWLVLDNLTKEKERIVNELDNRYSIEQTFDYAQGSKVMLLAPIQKPSGTLSVTR